MPPGVEGEELGEVDDDGGVAEGIDGGELDGWEEVAQPARADSAQAPNQAKANDFRLHILRIHSLAVVAPAPVPGAASNSWNPRDAAGSTRTLGAGRAAAAGGQVGTDQE